MSLNEFITKLEKELDALPDNRREELVKDFEMQIQKAIELGDTEEYLLKILGEPRKVAEKFIAEEIAEEEAEPEQEKIGRASCRERGGRAMDAAMGKT